MGVVSGGCGRTDVDPTLVVVLVVASLRAGPMPIIYWTSETQQLSWPTPVC